MPRSPGGNPPPRGGEDLEYWLTALHLGASGATGADQVVHQVAKLVRVFTPPGVPRFVAYFRVSTDKQGVSGLGLEAQREAVSRHVAIAQGVIVAEFQEIESGKRNDRPQIAAALAACRLRRATLVIAKLDRLARNVFFISSLQESGVDFVACDNPHATRLTIQVLAAVAEHEREAIAERTKAALAAVKARGVKLGGPKLRQAQLQGIASNR